MHELQTNSYGILNIAGFIFSAATVDFQPSSTSIAEGDAGATDAVQVCLELTLSSGATLAGNVEAEVMISGGTASNDAHSILVTDGQLLQ